MNESLEKASTQRESHRREQIARSLTEDQRHCHQVFKTLTYEQYKNINPDRAKGTCRWVLENLQYLDWWKSCRNDLLWISADPECGKSVLTKSLIDIDFKKLIFH